MKKINITSCLEGREYASMIIGLDDTDSKEGMCTTYLMAILIEKLKMHGTIKELPLLIRLNPNITFRTRGNAALALHIELKNPCDAEKIKRQVIQTIENMAVFSDENTNPGVVFIEDASRKMQNELARFSIRAVRDVLEIHEAIGLLGRYGIDYREWKNGRGLIGSLAAAGFALTGLPDFTYELIAYREKKNWGMVREIDESSVWASASVPGIWDTVDHENRRIVFAPHTPDPILFGIRGESEAAVRHAFSLIKSEVVERFVVYRTNQNTDMHLIRAKISDVLDDRSYLIAGKVKNSPRTIKGGHVFFEIGDGSAALECAAFEPTKSFRSIVASLRPGDEVEVSGSVKVGTMNLEKLKIISLNLNESRNPLCCGKRMKSAGKDQGYRCEKCGATNKEKELGILHRNISPGFYEVPPCARRHLSKPLIRLHMTGAATSCEHWH
jgi:tRNA(Ile2)-agmatinylcytidine synthase